MKSIESIKNFIKEYDQQGYHRTGTQVDNLSGQWLIEKLEKIGSKPQKNYFRFNRIQIMDAKLIVNKKTIPGVPLFDSIQTENVNVEGILTKANTEKQIGLIKVFPTRLRKLNALRKKNKHLALVAITKGFIQGLSLINAENFINPYGSPVIQVASTYESILKENLLKRAQINIEFNREETQAFNIFLKLDGCDSSLRPFLILTPRSGWWNCASERGGGLAIWYQLVKHFINNKPKRDLYFLANSGHELGHLGFNNFLQKHLDLVKDIKIWFHIGANLYPSISNTDLESPILLQQTAKKLFNDVVLKHLKEVDAPPDLIIKQNQIPYGEVKEIFKKSYNYISILGGRNHYFHNKKDRWPSAINFDKTSRIGEAIKKIVSDLD